MKTTKKITITLILLSLISFNSLASGGKKEPPKRSTVETVQLYLAQILG